MAAEAPFFDYLQSPLQPLMDHLSSQTYEVFERDPVKYKKYEEAIHAALIDFKAKNGDEWKPVLVVVGAGRGPLVLSAIRASLQARIPFSKLYAVEKNPCAVVTLQNRDFVVPVEVVHCDMRDWHPEEKADIIVSELLGSFGDNEGSPECLDGALKHLKDGGISIPSEYTSFCAPMSSWKIHNNLCAFDAESYFETPYVVRLFNSWLISQVQEVHKFSHTHPVQGDESLETNERFCHLEFNCTSVGTVHGVAGFFEAILYKDITIGIHPDRPTPKMMSWFPLVFPLRYPLSVHPGDKVDVWIWRKCTKGSLWYEWKVSGQSILNIAGRSYRVGL